MILKVKKIYIENYTYYGVLGKDEEEIKMNNIRLYNYNTKDYEQFTSDKKQNINNKIEKIKVNSLDQGEVKLVGWDTTIKGLVQSNNLKYTEVDLMVEIEVKRTISLKSIEIVLTDGTEIKKEIDGYIVKKDFITSEYNHFENKKKQPSYSNEKEYNSLYRPDLFDQYTLEPDEEERTYKLWEARLENSTENKILLKEFLFPKETPINNYIILLFTENTKQDMVLIKRNNLINYVINPGQILHIAIMKQGPDKSFYFEDYKPLLKYSINEKHFVYNKWHNVLDMITYGGRF